MIVIRSNSFDQTSDVLCESNNIDKTGDVEGTKHYDAKSVLEGLDFDMEPAVFIHSNVVGNEVIGILFLVSEMFLCKSVKSSLSVTVCVLFYAKL